jgi:hypothetical protein
VSPLSFFLVRFALAVLALALLIAGHTAGSGALLLLSGLVLVGVATANFRAERGTVASLYPAGLGFALGLTLALLAGDTSGTAATARCLGWAVVVLSVVLMGANVLTSRRRSRA